jgi:hypothetical protein
MQTQMTDIDMHIHICIYVHACNTLSKEPTDADADDRYRYAGERHQ